MHVFNRITGAAYASDYKDQFKWTTKTGKDLNKAAAEWHRGGRQSDFEAKPEGWLTRDEMTSQISDLNKRYDALKINYDKLIDRGAPSVHESHEGWRDQHGGYGSQDTKVDNMKIAQQQATQAGTTTKNKRTPTPQQSQTYTGSASL